MTPDDTLKGLNTNLANANKALEIALQQLDTAVQALRVANMAMNIAMTKKEPWLCLLCKSGREGIHGTLDDGITPCPNRTHKLEIVNGWKNEY